MHLKGNSSFLAFHKRQIKNQMVKQEAAIEGLSLTPETLDTVCITHFLSINPNALALFPKIQSFSLLIEVVKFEMYSKATQMMFLHLSLPSSVCH